MLALKLFLVPLFLGLISLAGKRWGPGFAGWLAGLPIIVGPILVLLAIEQGETFAQRTAVYSLAGVASTMVFCVVYARTARRRPWGQALAAGYGAWGLAALALASLPLNGYIAIPLALGALWLARRLMPALSSTAGTRASLPHAELAVRMLAGALLVMLVTAVAAMAGSRVTGVLSLFPVLASILAVFLQRGGGADAAIRLLTGLAQGMYSLVAFCASMLWLLDRLPLAPATGISIALTLVVQAGLRAPARHQNSD
jgi:uncharacterized membrane protein (GlpM family)